MLLAESTLASTLPASSAVPLTLARQDVLALRNTMYCVPDRNARLPSTLIDVPGTPGIPGDGVPPLLTFIAVRAGRDAHEAPASNRNRRRYD